MQSGRCALGPFSIRTLIIHLPSAFPPPCPDRPSAFDALPSTATLAGDAGHRISEIEGSALLAQDGLSDEEGARLQEVILPAHVEHSLAAAQARQSPRSRLFCEHSGPRLADWRHFGRRIVEPIEGHLLWLQCGHQKVKKRGGE